MRTYRQPPTPARAHTRRASLRTRTHARQTADFNHFVIFDPDRLAACHGFEYM